MTMTAHSLLPVVAAALARRKGITVSTLLELLDSPRIEARYGACDALGSLGGAAARAVPALRRSRCFSMKTARSSCRMRKSAARGKARCANCRWPRSPPASCAGALPPVAADKTYSPLLTVGRIFDSGEFSGDGFSARWLADSSGYTTFESSKAAAGGRGRWR